jgi:predicted transcriptional regulator
MGRPPLPREIARCKRVVTFVSEQEKANLEQLADATSQSVSAVCHRLIAQGLERDERTNPNRNTEG